MVIVDNEFSHFEYILQLLEECAKTYRVLTDNELTLKSKAVKFPEAY
jgi:hypothetical protein